MNSKTTTKQPSNPIAVRVSPFDTNLLDSARFKGSSEQTVAGYLGKIISTYTKHHFTDKSEKEVNDGIRLIKRAYEIAKEEHQDQERDDGTPYIFHPLQVALMTAERKFPAFVVAAALLHDVLEDTKKQTSYQDLKKELSQKVADLVARITKPKWSAGEWVMPIHESYPLLKHTIDLRKKEERNEVFYSALFHSKNGERTDEMVYAINIKLYDVFHNMHNLDGVAGEKRGRVVRKTLKKAYWLAQRFFPEPDLWTFSNTLLESVKKEKARAKRNNNIPSLKGWEEWERTLTLEPKSKSILIVFNHRLNLSKSDIKSLPIVGTPHISIYGDINHLFALGWLEIGFPPGVHLTGPLLRKYLPESHRIIKMQSLVPISSGVHEQMFLVTGFKKIPEKIKMENGVLYTEGEKLSIRSYRFRDLKEKYVEQFEQMKKEYKEFKEGLRVLMHEIYPEQK
ncbi:HD domain-containing protein [Candidatus Micrarchaeota archaeon]|nr:HD domain-containing protein [Candidatus Micrarchaeota archaeon]